MNCNVNEIMQINATSVETEAQDIPQRESFRSLGSVISIGGDIEEDVEYRIRFRQLKWTLASRLF